MRQYIKNEIKSFVTTYDNESTLQGKWREPIVGFADADHPGFNALKTLVHPGHDMPPQILPDARIVISYFVPFTEKIVRSNSVEGLSSPEWAQAYEETNALFPALNRRLAALITAKGYHAAISKEAAAFDRERLVSKWSQRHIAALAGLGTFGLNNMLITDSGCCGRFSSLVTNLDLTPDAPLTVENCLYKRTGRCAACVSRCPTGALTPEKFDRHQCYGLCLKNARIYKQFGDSYASEAGGAPVSTGSEVCGKCLVGLPCSMKKP